MLKLLLLVSVLVVGATLLDTDFEEEGVVVAIRRIAEEYRGGVVKVDANGSAVDAAKSWSSTFIFMLM